VDQENSNPKQMKTNNYQCHQETCGIREY